jgi:hypothetical protein
LEPSVVVRQLREDDLPLAGITLGQAFRDDPFVEFLLRGSLGRAFPRR